MKSAAWAGRLTCRGRATPLPTGGSCLTWPGWTSSGFRTRRTCGSRFATDQSSCPRLCTAATLFHRETGKLLRFYNTHLDHEGPTAQAQGLSLILARMAADYARRPMPVILTGDFNAYPDSLVYRSAQGFAGCGLPLVDVTQATGGTFHDFGRLHPAEKIDYIFTNLPCLGPAFLAEDQEDGVYLSDHYPVGVELELS